MPSLSLNFPPGTPHVAAVGPLGHASDYVIHMPDRSTTIVYPNKKMMAYGLLFAVKARRDQAQPGPERDELEAQYQALVEATR
jgi:hypothetical protein